MRLEVEQQRLSAALFPDEAPLMTVESRTLFPASRGLFAVTPARIVYTSKKWSWAAELRNITTVSLTRERARGAIRITSAKIEVFNTAWNDAQQVVGTIQAALAALR